MKIGDREYREVVASDYPLLVLGKLQAFYIPLFRVRPSPAKLLGTNFERDRDAGPEAGWMISSAGLNRGDILRYGNDHIFIDVTPRKRFCVWSIKNQRFCVGSAHPNRGYFDTRAEAEAYVVEFCCKYGVFEEKYTVVEFNVPEANDA